MVNTCILVYSTQRYKLIGCGCMRGQLAFLARLFLEKTRGIAIALASSFLLLSCKNSDILLYRCHYSTYVLETQNRC